MYSFNEKSLDDNYDSLVSEKEIDNLGKHLKQG